MPGKLADYVEAFKTQASGRDDTTIADIAKKKRYPGLVEKEPRVVEIGNAIPEAIVKAGPTILPTTNIGDYSARAPQPMSGPPGLVSSPTNSRTPLTTPDKQMLGDYGSYLSKNNPELTPEDITKILQDLEMQQIAKRQHDMVQPKPVTLRATENAWSGR